MFGAALLRPRTLVPLAALTVVAGVATGCGKDDERAVPAKSLDDARKGVDLYFEIDKSMKGMAPDWTARLTQGAAAGHRTAQEAADMYVAIDKRTNDMAPAWIAELAAGALAGHRTADEAVDMMVAVQRTTKNFGPATEMTIASGALASGDEIPKTSTTPK